MDSIISAFNLEENSVSFNTPLVSKKIEDPSELQFVETREAFKSQSLHNSIENKNDTRSYLRDKNVENNPQMTSSLKKNYRQLEMNKYIQEAKNELKSSMHY